MSSSAKLLNDKISTCTKNNCSLGMKSVLMFYGLKIVF